MGWMRVAWAILCYWLLYFSWYVPLDRSSVAAEECSVSSVMVEGLSGEVRASPSPSSPGGAVGLKYFLPQAFFLSQIFFASNMRKCLKSSHPLSLSPPIWKHHREVQSFPGCLKMNGVKYLTTNLCPIEHPIDVRYCVQFDINAYVFCTFGYR